MNKTEKVIKKEDTKTLWQEQLDNLFIIDTEKKDMKDFLSILTLMINDKYDEKLVALYTVVNNIDLFSSIIDEFSGMTLIIPTKEEFMDVIKIALTYYYKEIKNMSWKEIQKIIPNEENLALKTSKGISRIKKEIKELLTMILKDKEDCDE